MYTNVYIVSNFGCCPILTSFTYAIKFCKFKTTNHYLSIKIGRWQNIDRENKTCNFYNMCTCSIGDEYHFIIECAAFLEQQK